MAFDGVLLYGLAKELEAALAGGRVDKIQQPEKDEIHLIIRSKGSNHKLVLSANASYPRIHLTRQSKTNPLSPPVFCMVLRKHLLGSRLIFINQPGMERILEIGFDTVDELGDQSRKTLVIETMGRHSNIILMDSNALVLDAIKHINHSISRIREVLPGRPYSYPPSQNKINPLTVEMVDVKRILQSTDPENRLANLLTRSYTGISKATAEEICYRGGEEPCKIAVSFMQFFQQVKDNDFQPTLLMDQSGKPRDIFPMVYTLYPPSLLKSCSSFSEALDDFFVMRDQMERLQQRSAQLHRIIKNNLERCYKKLALQKDELANAKSAKQYRLLGELITSNIHQIPTGAAEVTLLNYYDVNNAMITIPLDPTKTPAQNAQYYYKLYNKAQRVLKNQSRLIKETQEELDYLESISQHLSMSTHADEVSEIREELVRGGYIREQSKNRGVKKQSLLSKPHRFLSSDGFEILVGKNNIQNDQLTLKNARSNDLWLHTKNIHGSHVIVRTEGKPVPNTTILEAANLAAYYSKGHSSANVPVDYCLRKNVKKPGGAKPGMVIYEQHKTIYVTPSEAMVSSMDRL